MPGHQRAKNKSDKQHLFTRISDLEPQIDQATALANAIALMGAGLRARRADGSEALIAITDALEDQLAYLKGCWRGLHIAAGGRSK